MAVETVIKSKLTVKDLGNPRIAANFEEGSNQRHPLGIIMGIAEKVRTVVDAAGQPFDAILGEFEGIRHTPQKIKDKDDEGNEYEREIGIVRAGRLFLPSGIHEMIAIPLKAEGAVKIQFGIRVFTVKADNPIGYSYVVEPLYKPETADPLAHIRESIAATVKQLSAPKPELVKKDDPKVGKKTA